MVYVPRHGAWNNPSYPNQTWTPRITRSGALEMLTWGAVALALVVYMRQSYGPPAMPPSAVNTDEPDATRWKHNGEQTLKWTRGNGLQHKDQVAYEMNELLERRPLDDSSAPNLD